MANQANNTTLYNIGVKLVIHFPSILSPHEGLSSTSSMNPHLIHHQADVDLWSFDCDTEMIYSLSLSSSQSCSSSRRVYELGLGLGFNWPCSVLLWSHASQAAPASSPSPSPPPHIYRPDDLPHGVTHSPLRAQGSCFKASIAAITRLRKSAILR